MGDAAQSQEGIEVCPLFQIISFVKLISVSTKTKIKSYISVGFEGI